jgi:hypothetical protein
VRCSRRAQLFKHQRQNELLGKFSTILTVLPAANVSGTLILRMARALLSLRCSHRLPPAARCTMQVIHVSANTEGVFPMATTNKKMITGVFNHRADWQGAFEWLRDNGYADREINVLMSEGTRASYLEEEQHEGKVHAATAASEGVAVGGAVGTAIGATLGAILAIGTAVAIPGIGIVAGPIAAAILGGGAGAVAGGALGGLVGLGIPEPNAKAYLEALRKGGVVLGVVPHSADDRKEIKESFENHNGENICNY